MFDSFDQEFITIPDKEVKTPEQSFDDCSGLITKEINDVMKERYINKYTLYYDAVKVVQSRYKFFLTLLENSRGEREKWIDEIGDEDLTKRLCHAIVGCYEKYKSLVETLNELESGYVNRIQDYIKAGKSDERMYEMFDRKKTKKKKPKMTTIDYLKRGMNSGSLLSSGWGLGSKCEKTGVCQCKNEGYSEPYIYTCIPGEESRLLRGKEDSEKRMKQKMSGMLDNMTNEY